jgi:hypothetical protein
VTTITQAPWSISGTGNRAVISAQLGGTSPAGTINAGSLCVFY